MESTPLEQGLEPKSIQQKNQQDPDTLKERPRPALEQPQKRKKRHLLSFEDEIDDDSDKITKNKADTKIQSTKQSLEEQLKQEYINTTEKLKDELIEFDYSYWEGTKVIKKLRRKKKEKIKDILQVCRLQLIQNFQNLALCSSKDLLLIIKDFIAPHDITLAEIQIQKLKTVKNDPLLNLQNVKVKKDSKELTLSVNLEGPFRIIEKEKYETSKADFPFCKWYTLSLK